MSQELVRLAAATGYTAGPPAPIDEPLLALALREQVAPLLGWRLVTGVSRASPSVSATLRTEYRRCLAAGVVRDAALAPMIAAIARRGIPMLWLKGAALVRTVYPDPGARWMGDLDILVPPDRFRDALAASLSAGGTRVIAPGRAFTADHDYATMIRSPRGAALEIHRALSPGDRLPPRIANDSHALMRTLTKPDLAPSDRPLLPEPSPLFVSLAIHAAKHGFSIPFRSLIDGLALVAAGQVDPTEVAACARRLAARRATAIWIRALVRFGLPADPWAALARALADDRLAHAIADGAPYGAGAGATVGTAPRLTRLARIAGSLDRPAAAAAWLANRVTLRLCDALQAAYHLGR